MARTPTPIPVEHYNALVELYAKYPGQHDKVVGLLVKELQKLDPPETFTVGRAKKIWELGLPAQSLQPIKEVLEVLVEEERFALEAEAEEMPLLIRQAARQHIRTNLARLSIGTQQVMEDFQSTMKGERLSLHRASQVLIESLARDLHMAPAEGKGSLSTDDKFMWLQRLQRFKQQMDDRWITHMGAEKLLQGKAQVVAQLGGRASDSSGPAGLQPPKQLTDEEWDREMRIMRTQLDEHEQLQKELAAARAEDTIDVPG